MSPTSRSTSDRATTSPKILRGLQHPDTTETLRENIFALLEKSIRLLDQINQLVVAGGHVLAQKSPNKTCMSAATPLSMKPTFTSPPTSTC
jgi:hypothetical protein